MFSSVRDLSWNFNEPRSRVSHHTPASIPVPNPRRSLCTNTPSLLAAALPMPHLFWFLPFSRPVLCGGSAAVSRLSAPTHPLFDGGVFIQSQRSCG